MSQETDRMICRACGNEERASEGYPCDGCGTFICVICSMRGVTLCRACQAKTPPSDATNPDAG
jgi:late competence protein required for DNA uptake (superfamily II DNA/RNA helicase)